MKTLKLVALLGLTFLLGCAPIKDGYTRVKLDNGDILVIWLKHELPETDINLVTYTDASGVKHNSNFLVVEHLTDGFFTYNMSEIIAWGIDK